MIAPGEIGLGIDGVDAHIPHDPSDTLLVEHHIINSFEQGCDRPVAPGWLSSVALIDQAPDSVPHH